MAARPGLVTQHAGTHVLAGQREQLRIAAGFADPQHLARFGIVLQHGAHIDAFTEVAQQGEVDARGDAQAGVVGVH